MTGQTAAPHSEYRLGIPHPALANHVVSYSAYRESSAVTVRRRQAPDGLCPLILGLAGTLHLHGPSGTTTPQAFLAGMHDRAVLTEFTGEQWGVQVNLTPLGAYELLGRPMSNLANRAVPLDALDAADLARLPTQLATDADWPTRFARVDAVLQLRLQESTARADPAILWAWKRLEASAGAVEVRELATQVGMSRRHLLTLFRQQIGLTPKTVARVQRFRRATLMLAPADPAGGPPRSAVVRTIGAIAATCGYTDHSHLVREFHALAGCTPSQYVAEWATT